MTTTTVRNTRGRSTAGATARQADGGASPGSGSSVVAALERELAELPAEFAGSTLAASAMALAREMDKPGNSATSKSMCARALNETLEKLRAQIPEADEGDELDELAARRAERLAAAADKPVA